MENFQRKLMIAILALGLVCVFGAKSHAQSDDDDDPPFGKDVPYQQAIPNLIEEIIEETEGLIDVDAINEWEQATRARLGEFIQDFEDATFAFIDKELGKFQVDEMIDATNKWNEVISEAPVNIEELEPVVSTIEDTLFEGLPELGTPQPNDPPYANYFRWYQAMEAENPWGLAAFFQLENINETIVKEVAARVEETTTSGVSSQFIIFKEKNIAVNEDPVFHILIINDEVQDSFEQAQPRTLLHEMLGNLIVDNGDPDLIEGFEWLIDLVDEQLDEWGHDNLTEPFHPWCPECNPRVFKGGKEFL